MTKLTVRDLLEGKGQRQLTEVFCATPEEATACESAGIDMIVSELANDPRSFRDAAPNTFLTLAIRPRAVATPPEAVRAGLEALDHGADAVYTGAGFAAVAAMAEEGVPTVGHVGYIPYKATWFGGPRAVGKTAEEAVALRQRALRYQEAGAIAIELELVPVDVARVITKSVDLIVLSMGSGAVCDGQYLFATDILGKNTGHVPRHARSYRNLAADYERIHRESVAAFEEFAHDVASGDYPSAKEEVHVPAAEIDRVRVALAESEAIPQHPRLRQVGARRTVDDPSPPE